MSKGALQRLPDLAVERAIAFLFPSLLIIAPRATVPVLAGLTLLFVARWLYARRGFPALAGAKAWMWPLFALLLWSFVSTGWAFEPEKAARRFAEILVVMALGGTLVSFLFRLSPKYKSLIMRAAVLGYLVGLAFLAEERLTHGGGNYLIRAAMDRLPMDLNLLKPTTILFGMLLWPVADQVRQWKGIRWSLTLVMATTALLFSFGSAGLILATIGGLTAFAWGRLSPRGAAVLVGAAIALAVIVMPGAVRLAPQPDAIVSAHPEWPIGPFYRLYIWKFSEKSIWEKPVIGWGLDSSRYLQKHKTDDGTFVPDRIFEDGADSLPNQSVREFWLSYYRSNPLPLHPHNGALQIWLELGGVGAGIAAWFLWAALRSSRHDLAQESLPYATGLMASAALPAFLNFGLWQSWWLAALWLMAGLMALAAQDGGEVRGKEEKKTPRGAGG